jgi:hypothetical protein
MGIIVKTRSKMAIGVFAVLGVVVASVAVAVPAQAAVTDCTSGHVCFWKDASYTNTFWSETSTTTFSSAHKNIASSTVNDSGYVVYFYTGSSETGSGLRLGNGGTYIDLSGQYPFNDNIESVGVLK